VERSDTPGLVRFEAHPDRGPRQGCEANLASSELKGGMVLLADFENNECEIVL